MANYKSEFTGTQIDNCIKNPTFITEIPSIETTHFSSNIYYKFGERSSLNIILNEPTQTERSNYYYFDFISGTAPTTLSIPDYIKWANDEEITIEANKKYIICINANNMMAVWGGTSI